MTRLSVNVNKVALLRNSRPLDVPSVVNIARLALAAGAQGITVHPRPDGRHIRRSDVGVLLNLVRSQGVEFNIEGDPRPDLIELVRRVRPDQCTLVPVVPGEITSQAGWTAGSDAARLPALIADLKSRGVRISVFVDPAPEAIQLAASVGADRVELYTEPYARAFERGPEAAGAAFATYAAAAELAHRLGLGVNAGHDLDLDNLTIFRGLPHLDEVSIGHAIMSRALFVGLDSVIREYLTVLSGHPPA